MGVIGGLRPPKIELFFCKNNKSIYFKFYSFTFTKQSKTKQTKTLNNDHQQHLPNQRRR
jgi:hypothetical protein